MLTYYNSTYDSKNESNTNTSCLVASLRGRCPISILPFKIKGVYQPEKDKDLYQQHIHTFTIQKDNQHSVILSVLSALMLLDKNKI